MKHNGQCVISDFGLAVKHVADSDEIEIAQNGRIGTRRYAAPETLDQTLDVKSFEAYKMADMYSLGLIFWEICRRCVTNSPSAKVLSCEDYELPYYDYVPSDPTWEQMCDVICVKNIRPSIPSRWQNDDYLAIMSKVMQECWSRNPSARLSALRVKKSLNKLNSEIKTNF